MTAQENNEQNFEGAIRRLDEIIASLDSGVISLDSSLALFSEGSQLITYCDGVLEDAKVRLEELFPEENLPPKGET
jgi:exodeoxyribonuclease VII small subunit